MVDECSLELSCMPDEELIEKYKDILEQSSKPLMIKDLAEKSDTSRQTAGKYIDIMEARGMVDVDKIATAKQITLKESEEG